MGSIPDAALGRVAPSTFLTVFLTALWIRAAWFGAGRLQAPWIIELRLWNDLDD